MMAWKKWDGTGRLRRFLDIGQDQIYYYREYSSWQGFEYSETNNLITNLKIGPNPSNRIRLRFREHAIGQFAKELRSFIQPTQRDLWVAPIPPSEALGDPEYDDRIDRVVDLACKNISRLHPVRPIYTAKTRPKLHHGLARDPEQLAATYAWREVNLAQFDVLLLIDDVLTHGTNFRAMSNTMRSKYDHLQIVGVFWAVAIYE